MNKNRSYNKVIKIATQCAKDYDKLYAKYEYLIISDAFPKGYVLMNGDPQNFLHLVGVRTNISPLEFFNKCLNDSLTCNDFNLRKRTKEGGYIDLTHKVNNKLQVLPYFCNMFSYDGLYVQQPFRKGSIEGYYATSNSDGSISLERKVSDNDKFTIVFVEEGKPKSLLNGSYLNANISKPVDCVLRREKGKHVPFSHVVFANLWSTAYTNSNIEYFNRINEKIALANEDLGFSSPSINEKMNLSDKIFKSLNNFFESIYSFIVPGQQQKNELKISDAKNISQSYDDRYCYTIDEFNEQSIPNEFEDDECLDEDALSL